MHHSLSALTTAEERVLREFLRKGTHKAREISRAEILLLAYEGVDIATIATRVRRCARTVKRVCGRFERGGLDRALADAPRSGQPKKTTATDDAHLIAIACTRAPKGSAQWTLELLKKKFTKDRKKTIGTTAIWQRLSTRGIKPWREKNVVHSDGYTGVHGTDGGHTRTVRTAV